MTVKSVLMKTTVVALLSFITMMMMPIFVFVELQMDRMHVWDHLSVGRLSVEVDKI